MHSNKNNNELKKYTQGLRRFKFTIPKNVKKIINKKGNLFYDILEKWDYLVGNKISSISYPKSIKLNKRENSNTLQLVVNRGDEITIEYSKTEIINKLNSYFGYKAINNVKIEKTETRRKDLGKSNFIREKNLKKYHNKISEIKSKNIKDALLKLINIIK
tara:strand:- start:218 stop:697 length:480 start_codon:yes stop_codon:yes gene_type:complete